MIFPIDYTRQASDQIEQLQNAFCCALTRSENALLGFCHVWVHLVSCYSLHLTICVLGPAPDSKFSKNLLQVCRHIEYIKLSRRYLSQNSISYGRILRLLTFIDVDVEIIESCFAGVPGAMGYVQHCHAYDIVASSFIVCSERGNEVLILSKSRKDEVWVR